MADHARTIIRNTVITSLSSLISVDSVHNMAIGIFPEGKTVNVLTLDESVSNENGCMDDLGEQTRGLRLVIEIRVADITESDDELDTITDEIEEAMLNDAQLGALAYNITLETLVFEYDRESGTQMGKALMTFSFLYQTDGANPSTIL